MSKTQSTLYLPYKFSDEELEEMAATVFENIKTVQDKKAEKKASNRSYNKQIEALEEMNVNYGNLIQTGSESRYIAVEIDYNLPVDGKKTITRMDDATQWVEDMSIAEYNLENLPLQTGVSDGSNNEDEEDLEPVVAGEEEE